MLTLRNNTAIIIGSFSRNIVYLPYNTRWKLANRRRRQQQRVVNLQIHRRAHAKSRPDLEPIDRVCSDLHVRSETMMPHGYRTTRGRFIVFAVKGFYATCETVRGDEEEEDN